MADNEFERRKKMFAAIEANDDQSLTALIKEDNFYRLGSYGRVLIAVVNNDEDGNPALLQKLLDHPALDKTSRDYKAVVAGTFSSLGSNNENPNPEILKLLLDKFKDEPKLKDQSLSFIFSTVALFARAGNDVSSVEAARMLMQNGASLDNAFSSQAVGLEAQKKNIDRQLDALRQFKTKVARP